MSGTKVDVKLPAQPADSLGTNCEELQAEDIFICTAASCSVHVELCDATDGSALLGWDANEEFMAVSWSADQMERHDSTFL